MVEFWDKNRNLFAAFFSMIAAYAVVFVVELINHKIYPVPQELLDAGESDKMQMIKDYVKNAPKGALVMVVVAYMLASFTGGYVARYFSKSAIWPLIFFVAVFLFTVLAQFYQIPHPLWVVVSSIVGVVAFAILGSQYAVSRKSKIFS